jgi:hypothetical protein
MLKNAVKGRVFIQAGTESMWLVKTWYCENDEHEPGAEYSNRIFRKNSVKTNECLHKSL